MSVEVWEYGRVDDPYTHPIVHTSIPPNVHTTHSTNEVTP